MANSLPTLRRKPMSLWTFLILSLLFPAQGSKAAQRTAAQAQSAGGQVAVTRLIVTVRDEGGGTFSGLATVSLQHLDSPVFSTGTAMCGQSILQGVRPGEGAV